MLATIHSDSNDYHLFESNYCLEDYKTTPMFALKNETKNRMINFNITISQRTTRVGSITIFNAISITQTKVVLLFIPTNY